MSAFDLDGCLVETGAAHKAAFQEAGYTPPTEGQNVYLPARFWYKESEAVRDKKHLLFPRHLRRLGMALPASSRARAGDFILTGTSRRSFRVVSEQFPFLQDMNLVGCAMGPDDKIEWLRSMPPGVYYDDWSEFIDRVRRETQWQAIDVSAF